jgi:hypothetical protein
LTTGIVPRMFGHRHASTARLRQALAHRSRYLRTFFHGTSNPQLWSVRSACIMILVGSAVWLLTSALPEPSLAQSAAQLPLELTKIE